MTFEEIVREALKGPFEFQLIKPQLKDDKLSDIKITQDEVKKLIELSKIEDVKMGEKSTVVSATLPSGFIIIESSSCVDPDNYDHELGKKICMKRIEDKIRELEGYRLQSSL